MTPSEQVFGNADHFNPADHVDRDLLFQIADRWIEDNGCVPIARKLNGEVVDYFWYRHFVTAQEIDEMASLPPVIFDLLIGTIWGFLIFKKYYDSPELALNALQYALVLYQGQGNSIGGTDRHLRINPEQPR